MNAGGMFAGMLAANYVLVVGNKIVEKTFGYTTDGKDYQQPGSEKFSYKWLISQRNPIVF